MRDSRTTYVLLGMLAIEGAKSGYDLRKGIEETVGHFWGESYGQIYPTLKRMTVEGLIVAVDATKGSGKRRIEYSLTVAGRERLREWLALPFVNDPPRNEFLLKLFFGREASPDVALAHVKNCNEKNRAMLALLKGYESMGRQQAAQNPHMPYWMLTLDLGAALTEAALQWGEKALVQLEGLKERESRSEVDAPQNVAKG